MFDFKNVIVLIFLVTSMPLLASSPCGHGSTNLADISYCQIASQLNKPTRWIESKFTPLGQTSKTTTRATIVNGTTLYHDGSSSNATTLQLHWSAPHFKDKFRIQFTTNQATNQDSTGSGSVSAKKNTGFSSAVMSAFTSNRGSAQIGIAETDSDALVLFAQASLTWVHNRGASTWGATQRVRRNHVDGTSWFNLLYWDHRVSTATLLGFDNTSTFAIQSQEGTSTSTMRIAHHYKTWLLETAVAAEYLFEPPFDRHNYWTSMSAEHTLGRSWLKGQIVPALYWRDIDDFQPKPQVTINFIVDIFQ